ncbi:uncharacterized protein LOC114518567 [Dendronephthya gigantea]|uniref:uncharacterized protein LOC114518567 n=1 Tax=Dendronephthya gigantea TaxID=151771 RepID=UPI00106C2C6F|nr:uncharacterized protein LOC114518567 [Dendronephthya gigantea]
MAERIRNPDWEEDAELKQDLNRYVLQNLSRREILDFVSRDYAQYAWSLGTLSRRLAFFNIKYVEYNTDLNDVVTAVQKELEGPGQYLGYRSIHRKIREQHNLAVPRNLVYDLMTEFDPEGLERRGNVGVKKHKRGNAGTFTSMGPNHTHSGDGHDKLLGYMNYTFPLAVYGLQDAYSVISDNLRLDKGTETGHMATIHSYLRQQGDEDINGAETVHYGPSTSNKIERWWRELHNRFERFFKRQLMMLLERGHYDPNNETDRNLLAFVYIPVVQKEMDIFRETVWNSHRVRYQRHTQLPKGIPNHLYSFPQQYGAEDCGLPVTHQALDEVAEISGVMDVGDDFLSHSVRRECERVIPNIENVKAIDAADTYLFLKANYQQPPPQ